MSIKNKLAFPLMLVLLAGLAPAALAAGPGNGPRLDWAGQVPRMVDLNQDGIADWVQNQDQWQAGSGGRYGAWLDANHDGLHDAWQNRAAWESLTGGRYGTWADANGDGICDNFDLRPQDGSGNGYKGGN